jgi:hypothetical protein
MCPGDVGGLADADRFSRGVIILAEYGDAGDPGGDPGDAGDAGSEREGLRSPLGKPPRRIGSLVREDPASEVKELG